MTTLTVGLTSTLQKTLGSAGAYAYAVYFDASGTAQWTPLVVNGALQASTSPGRFAIDLPSPLDGGKVYFLIQSQDPSAPQTDLTKLITQQSQINWGSAATYQYRYDSFEVTLLGSSGDAGNLTSVEGFGIPMQISIPHADGTTDTRGYGVSGTQLFNALDRAKDHSLVYFTDGPLKGSVRGAISPAQSVIQPAGDQVYKASDWTAYIDSLKKADTGITVSGFFNGAEDGNGIYHDAGFFGYRLDWVAGTNGQPGHFWLSPTASSQIKGHIKISAEALAGSIYSTLGSVEIYASRSDAMPYKIFGAATADMNTGANTQWGEVLTQVLTGFTAGYYGTSGQPLNPFVSGQIDLNKNWNWDPTYAFNQNLAGKSALFHDVYSQVFFNVSNSYGSGYSDNLMDAYAQGGPLISVSDQINGTWQNVKTINLTLYADSETPGGYVQPEIFNVIEPIGHVDFGTKAFLPGSYSPVEWAAVNPCSVTLNFFNQDAILKDGTPVTLRLFDGVVNGTAVFQDLSLNPASGGSLWQNWAVSFNAVSGTYVINAVANTPQTAGSLVISSLPTPQDGVGWYQIIIGSGAAAKTFNLYTRTDGGLFLNPAVDSQGGSIAVDGLALVAPQTSTGATIQTFALDFLYSGSSTLSPDLLTWNTDPTHVSQKAADTAPVAGTLSGGTFTALANQTNLVSNTITTTSALELAFGWTGTNSATGTTSWISNTTNKVAAGNLAVISFKQQGKDVLGPLTATGDIDGMWQTGQTQALGNGTYTIQMTEHLHVSGRIGAAVSPASSALTVTVDVDEAALAANAAGNGLTLATGNTPAPAANWVRLTAQSESVQSGVTVLVYAVDSKGNLVDQSGRAGSSVTLADAVRGSIGAATDDAGNTLALGTQTVLLRQGEELRFASLSGNDGVTQHAGATVTPAGNGGLTVAVAGVTISAATDNTLGANALVASAQRASDLPLLHLSQNQAVSLVLTGSTSLQNTLGFVRLDVDLAGNISLNGIGIDSAAAFRAEVARSLDAGGTFTFTSPDTATQTSTWTVAGKTGFYAPVLKAGTGEIFVLGAANSDGREHIRLFGENTFGFEDLTAAQGADFDYNDLVVALSVSGQSSTQIFA
ncbi:DUF4114 domain-containing protein [Pannonibacter tanglangensis]|uniref:Uncharacterized protein n=1 Tax=Pannonibacter tanglangensis TaxID=2750084 RepID=A0ABW9ZIT0_9HYPH|nr:DUF4114 domain-containing protein [Pannonibacter sp. XCT-34]NBN64291.1 hypothetical protein [Pannonibacter sp. XCT-34]